MLRAVPPQGGTVMTEYERKIIAYRMAVSLAKSVLKQGIITAEEYAEIDTIMAKKYGVSSCTIFREITG